MVCSARMSSTKVFSCSCKNYSSALMAVMKTEGPIFEPPLCGGEREEKAAELLSSHHLL